MNKIKELRLELGLSREELARELLISPRTLMGWETGETKIKAMTEKLVLYKLENMVKEKKPKTGLIMLDGLMEEKNLFTAEQATVIARAAIIYQLAWFKTNDPDEYYIYTPEILEDTLTKICPEIFADIDTGEIDAEELIKKDVSFISTKDIVDMIQRKSVFIY